MTQNDDAQQWNNRVLDSVPAATMRALAPHLERVGVARGTITTQAGKRLAHVDFPIDAAIAIVAGTPGGKTIEAALIGSEGYVESDGPLGARDALRSAVCRLPGSVWRFEIEAFRSGLREDDAFARAIRRATRSRVHVMEQAVFCSAHHTMDQRLARWLLEARDRSGRERFGVTQAELAGVLGVRRAGISLTVARLRRAGAVANERSAMIVTDYERLRRASCECYDAMRDAVSGVLD